MHSMVCLLTKLLCKLQFGKQKLKELEATSARALREGRLEAVAAAELVPGDVIEVGSGDKCPADCRLLELRSAVLSIDESMLTGESENVLKQLAPVEAAVNQDKRNLLFSGTLVTRGSARGAHTPSYSHSSLAWPPC